MLLLLLSPRPPRARAAGAPGPVWAPPRPLAPRAAAPPPSRPRLLPPASPARLGSPVGRGGGAGAGKAAASRRRALPPRLLPQPARRPAGTARVAASECRLSQGHFGSGTVRLFLEESSSITATRSKVRSAPSGQRDSADFLSDVFGELRGASALVSQEGVPHRRLSFPSSIAVRVRFLGEGSLVLPPQTLGRSRP